MSKHKPGSVWMFRRLGQYPNGCVGTLSNKLLEIQIRAERNPFHDKVLIMSRADARLLAKRILECLEATK